MRIDSRGIALVSVVLCLLTSLVLMATLFISWFVDAQATANASAGDDALHVAESGIEHLWSILEPAPDFARELGWPGGEPPFGAIVGFPAPPRTYRVSVREGPGDTLSAVSRATSRRGTRRDVEAIFRRGPFRPAAALVVAPGTALHDLSGTLDVAQAGGDPEFPAVATEARTEAAALRAIGGGFAGTVIAGESGFSRALAPLRDAADETFYTPQSGGTWGTDAGPRITRLAVGADLSGTITATGIVIADGPLRITGSVEVHGLLVAPAGLEVTGELTIHGAVWVATELGLPAGATIALIDSESALAAAEIAGRGVLPRPAVLAAWRESW